MKKKLIVWTTVIWLLVCSATAAYRYTDVTGKSWYTEPVDYVTENGIMSGLTETEFAPNSLFTRTDLVCLLYEYAIRYNYDVSVGEDTNILSYNDAFDISEGCYEAFQWACGSGLLGGDGVTALYPNETLTREEMLVLLHSFTVFCGIDVSIGNDVNILSYDDALDISEGCFEAFQWACGSGLIVGTSATNLSPVAIATRAELATVLTRYDKLVMKEADNGATVGIANPITETDAQNVLENTGILFKLPDEAENIAYYIIDMEDEYYYDMAQASFILDGVGVTYRIMGMEIPDGRLTDISGMYFDWTDEASAEIGGNEAELHWIEGEQGIVLWYDFAPGLLYSVSIDSGASESFLTELADMLYYPVQGDVE